VLSLYKSCLHTDRVKWSLEIEITLAVGEAVRYLYNLNLAWALVYHHVLQEKINAQSIQKTEKDSLEANCLNSAAKLFARGEHTEDMRTFRRASQLGEPMPVCFSETTSVRRYFGRTTES
jgi:hypothetical protein